MLNPTQNSEYEKVHILGVGFHKITFDQALTLLLQKLTQKRADHPFFVATPNPEMILESRKNEQFKKTLENTDLNIADGIGILWASYFLKKTAKMKKNFWINIKWFLSLIKVATSSKKIRSVLPERVTGTDMMQALCQKVTPETKIFLLGAGEGVAEIAAEKLQKIRKLNIVGTHSGNAGTQQEKNILNMINQAEPDLLFIAFGAPKQEFWIERNLPYLTTVKVVIGVGGAFDFISGMKKRAPKIFQKLGIEWLFRLIIQPSRWLRIFNATVKFPLLILKSAKAKPTKN
jgi:N-acetylglucosaminyldiphosphoundecaprenol N-acetyl-beta-D-mannosaminyltransferase